MVRALLTGTKTQTRRIVKPQPTKLAGPNFDGCWSDTIDPVVRYFSCPYGYAGDRLWVKETFGVNVGAHIHYGCGRDTEQDEVQWRADKPQAKTYEEWSKGGDLWMHNAKWKPSIFMPRAFSRITLEIESVRVERLNEISEADAIAEGVDRVGGGRYWLGATGLTPRSSARVAYRDLWESINGKGSWDANPYVWVIAFRRVEQ